MQDKLMRAKVRLMIEHPFFASIVQRRPIVLSNEVSTACIDKSGAITVSPKFLAKLSLRQIEFLLAHEAMHFALDHLSRMGNRDRNEWNIACDKVINDILIDAHCGDPIDDMVHQPDARKFSAEQLYREPDRDARTQYVPGEGTHDLSDKNPGGLSDTELRQQARNEIVAAAQTAKRAGTLPASIARIVEAITRPALPWRELLERYMLGVAKSDVTWAKPRRKLLPHDIYLPSEANTPKMGELVIAIDTSGSITRKMCDEFIAHVNDIIDRCQPNKVYLLHVDAAVQRVDEFEPDDYPISIGKLVGGGGTDMREALRWIDSNGVDPDACLIFTDGYTPYPDTAPRYPLVWLQTCDRTSPVGENISCRS